MSDRPEMFEGADTIWMDGEFVDWDDAQIHVLTHSLHYGSAAFEGIRCYDSEQGPAIFRLEPHLERFYESAKVLDHDLEFELDELSEAIQELIRRQEMESCYIRPIVFYGYKSLGVGPGSCPTRVAIACWPWGAYLGEEAIERGVAAKISSWRKYASSQIPTSIKATGAYINNMLAGEEARREGYVEAIMLNKEGQVAEGAGENLFLVRDGEVYTPGLAESILGGITRDSVITIARDLGYTVHDEATISRGELYNADELFFTGTAAEVTPIRQVDNIEIGTGSRGPITEEIQNRFFDVIERRTDDYDEWFTYVDF